jgi:hypothetical protein
MHVPERFFLFFWPHGSVKGVRRSLTKRKKASGAVVIGVAGTGQPQSKFEVAAGRSVRVDIPESFTADHVALATRDSEILAEILTGHPHEFCQIVSAVTAGKFKEAQKLAEKIGLTEEYFIRQGGGMWAIVIGIAIGCALLLSHD